MTKYRLTKPGKVILANVAFTAFIFSLLMFSTVVQAVLMSTPVVSDDEPLPNESVNLKGNITIQTNEKIPMQTITFTVMKFDGSTYVANQTCTYNYTTKTAISSCDSFSNFNTNYTSIEVGYGYTTGIGSDFGYGNNYLSGTVSYFVDWTTPDVSSNTKFSITTTLTAQGSQNLRQFNSDAVNLTVIPEFVEVAPGDLYDLGAQGIFTIPSGSNFNETNSINVTQEVHIVFSNSTIILPEDLVISGTALNLSELLANMNSTSDVSGLDDVQSVMRWGIPGKTLTFTPAITLRMYVGAALNGQRLQIQRSVSGNSSWTTDGIVSPGTCIVSGGICEFSVTKASYYATTPAPVSSGNSGGIRYSGDVEEDVVEFVEVVEVKTQPTTDSFVEPTPTTEPTPTEPTTSSEEVIEDVAEETKKAESLLPAIAKIAILILVGAGVLMFILRAFKK